MLSGLYLVFTFLNALPFAWELTRTRPTFSNEVGDGVLPLTGFFVGKGEGES